MNKKFLVYASIDYLYKIRYLNLIVDHKKNLYFLIINYAETIRHLNRKNLFRFCRRICSEKDVRWIRDSLHISNATNMYAYFCNWDAIVFRKERALYGDDTYFFQLHVLIEHLVKLNDHWNFCYSRYTCTRIF